MAVGKPQTTKSSGTSRRKRIFVGTNVFAATIFVLAIVAVLQAIAYNVPAQLDMTSSGLNSLSDSSRTLIGNLEAPITITSLYFETDREEEEQQQYRRTADDLIHLYESTDRARITANWINPLKDHEGYKKLLKRLGEKPAFHAQLATYAERIEVFKTKLDPQINELIQSESAKVNSMSSGFGDVNTSEVIALVEDVLTRVTTQLAQAREQVEALTPIDRPNYTNAVGQLRLFYPYVSKVLNRIITYGAEKSAENPDLGDVQRDFLESAADRYSVLIEAIDEEISAIQALEPLKLDELTARIPPTGNAILVENSEDAYVIDFASVWPPVNPANASGHTSFHERMFKGEERLTSAILRLANTQQTAVVFARFSGRPLFSSMSIPGAPPPLFAAMKHQLEDANYTVWDWDLATSLVPPSIDPAPVNTVYVLLRPTPPKPQQALAPGAPGPPRFGSEHINALQDAIGQEGRMLFIAGWAPSDAGPAPYEYGDFLMKGWGIAVQEFYLLIEVANLSPGKYRPLRRDFYNLLEVETSDHLLVRELATSPISLPWCAPLKLLTPPRDGIERTTLLTYPAIDGVWAIQNANKYNVQLKTNDFMALLDGDREGPFTLGVVAEDGKAKVVVISARTFANDEVAFASELRMSGQGLTMRARNPGNVGLLINSIHWLSDNTDFMNIGQPIDSAVLEVEKATVDGVQVLTIFVWPLVALTCGGVVWWTRRR